MTTKKILQNIFKALRHDRIKFIKFCLEHKHAKKDIAEVVGLSQSGLSHFIKRYIKEKI